MARSNRISGDHFEIQPPFKYDFIVTSSGWLCRYSSNDGTTWVSTYANLKQFRSGKSLQGRGMFVICLFQTGLNFTSNTFYVHVLLVYLNFLTLIKLEGNYCKSRCHNAAGTSDYQCYKRTSLYVYVTIHSTTIQYCMNILAFSMSRIWLFQKMFREARKTASLVGQNDHFRLSVPLIPDISTIS